MFAWVQLLRYELDEVDAAYSWLTTVAIRQRRSSLTGPSGAPARCPSTSTAR